MIQFNIAGIVYRKFVGYKQPEFPARELPVQDVGPSQSNNLSQGVVAPDPLQSHAIKEPKVLVVVCILVDGFRVRVRVLSATLLDSGVIPVLSPPAWDRLTEVAKRAEDEDWRFELIGTSTVAHVDPPGWYRAFPIQDLLAQVITKINSRGSVTGI